MRLLTIAFALIISKSVLACSLAVINETPIKNQLAAEALNTLNISIDETSKIVFEEIDSDYIHVPMPKCIVGLQASSRIAIFVEQKNSETSKVETCKALAWVTMTELSNESPEFDTRIAPLTCGQ